MSDTINSYALIHLAAAWRRIQLERALESGDVPRFPRRAAGRIPDRHLAHNIEMEPVERLAAAIIGGTPRALEFAGKAHLLKPAVTEGSAVHCESCRKRVPVTGMTTVRGARYCPQCVVQCTSCQQWKCVVEFGKDSRKRSGVKSICRACDTSKTRQRRASSRAASIGEYGWR